MRPPSDFPAFGQPVLATHDGVVVRAHGRRRDHLSRNSWPALQPFRWTDIEIADREIVDAGQRPSTSRAPDSGLTAAPPRSLGRIDLSAR